MHLKGVIKRASVLLCCTFIVGCSSKKEYYEELKDDTYLGGFSAESLVTVGDKGYYYSNEAESYIYFWDSQTKKLIKLCGKADCQHDSTECNAYVEGLVSGSTQFINNQLFYLAVQDQEMSLFCMDSDGENHTKITNLYAVPTGEYEEPVSIIHKGYLYYIVNEVDANSDTSNEKIYRVKIEEEDSPELIYDGQGCEISNLTAKDNDIYFDKFSSDDELNFTGEVIQLSIESKEEKVIYSYDGTEYVTSFTLTDNELLCAIMDKGILKIKLDDLSSEQLYSNAEEYENGIDISYDGNYIYEDNQIQCDLDYYLNENESSYDNRMIYIRDLDGTLIDTISLKGAKDTVYFGDSSYLFSKSEQGLGVYDKSQIGTKKGKTVYY